LVRVKIVQVDARPQGEDFARFCVDAHPRLVAALAFQCGDRWLAEELAQEALIRAGDRWATVGRYDSPLGWAFRVGSNLAASTFRRRGAERRALDRMQAVGAVRDPDGGDTVAVQQALGVLTDRQRQVVVARYYLGLSVDETAASLGMGSGAVRMQCHRALARLRDELGSERADEEVRDG
jgi:RNA polymerase sigma factor (sigma-70 family)